MFSEKKLEKIVLLALPSIKKVSLILLLIPQKDKGSEEITMSNDMPTNWMTWKKGINS